MQIARWFTSSDSTNNDEALTNAFSAEASALLATDAFCATLPMELRVVEENTVPSWLWRHSGSGANEACEYSLQQIFDRVAGSATYQGWQKGLFANEGAARTFYDEARHLLSTGMIVIEPAAMAGLGVDWAYGLAPVPFAPVYAEAGHSLNLANTTIDAILSGQDNGAQNRWRRFLNAQGGQKLSLRFSDTTSEWGSEGSSPTPPVAIDLNRFVRTEGGVDVGGLSQATRMAVILLELHYEALVTSPQASRSLAIAPVNIASYLMRQGIAYDSDAGRSTAAGLAALITAVATETSAKLAQHFGPCADFTRDRVSALRFVANRRRAAYGDENDYDHVSVVPVPLSLDASPDLLLVAEARRAWDEAHLDAQRYGLRHAGLTQFAVPPVFATLCGAPTPGLAPLPTLVREERVGEDRYARVITPQVVEALARLGYVQEDMKAIVGHILGHNSLDGSPTLNADALKARGLTKDVIAKVQDYIPEVDDVRLAFTPWNVGVKFCLDVLKVPASKVEDFDFDLLEFLGFSQAEVVAANHYCYGYGSTEEASELHHEHRALFTCGEDVGSDAVLSMAAAVQSFVTGDVDLSLSLKASTKAELCSDLLITAWKQGLKSVSLYFDYEGVADAAPFVARAALDRPRRRAVGKPAPQSAVSKAEPVLAAKGHGGGLPTTKASSVILKHKRDSRSGRAGK